MSDNLIRCVHENGKVCFLTKAATENRAFMKKYGIRVEHVKKDLTEARVPIPGGISHSIALAEATKPAKPKAARKPRTKTNKK